MIIPKRHIAMLSQLTTPEKEEFFNVLLWSQRALQSAMKPQGFNLGMNMGDTAGAGIPNHLHWHLVPRWKGDVNFMPVVAQTKIISESLTSAYMILSLHLRKIKSSPTFKRKHLLNK